MEESACVVVKTVYHIATILAAGCLGTAN